jgi:hypothetical protein
MTYSAPNDSNGDVGYFALFYQLDAKRRYLIWISEAQDSALVDSVALDEGGFIPTFEDAAHLRRYADLNHYRLQDEEPILHDLDWVAAWTKSTREPINCENALAAWNLFGDVARSVGGRGVAFESLESRQTTIYNKLFWGNNLPSMTPNGCHYIPDWSADEIALLAEILTTGLDLFMSNSRTWPREL